MNKAKTLLKEVPPPSPDMMLRIMISEMMKDITGVTARENQQTQRVYHAQRLSGLEAHKSFRSFADCRAYFKEVWKSDFVRDNFPDRCTAPVKFVRGTSSDTSTTERYKPGIPELQAAIMMGNRNQWKKFIVIHEIAHLCCSRQVRHGTEFVKAYVKLLEHELGAKITKRVIKAFKEVKVEGIE